MKRIILVIIYVLFCHCNLFAEGSILWQQVKPMEVSTPGKQNLFPQHTLIYSAAQQRLVYILNTISFDLNKKQTIELPTPAGKLRTFIVWQTHIMQAELEAKYPEIKTFTAYAQDDPRVTAKIDCSPRGFHAMVFDGSKTFLIDPYTDSDDGYYLCYYKQDYNRSSGSKMFCAIDDAARTHLPQVHTTTGMSNARLTNGTILRTFRMALACTGEYAQAVAGSTLTKANVLSAMITSMNRVNGVYERELAITMQLVNNEDTIIFLTPGAYSNNDVFLLITQNQDTLDRRIGNANYDLGHVFSTGGGGYSQIACVCIPGQKAQSETGALNPVGDAYDIDYVAHEIGHEMGSDHSFNDNISGLCTGQAAYLEAYEPGSGSTIMCYAGLCSGDDLQEHSDDYFHAISLQVIYENITTGPAANCPVKTNTGNKPAGLPAFSASYNIPCFTPFELIAPQAIDSVADTLTTYCWEQWDRGDFGQTFNNTHKNGPIFRSFAPDTGKTRIFPKLTAILNDTLNYQGEKVPDSTRILHFKLTVRSIYNGIGSLHIPDDSIRLHAINGGSGFKVITPTSATRVLGNATTAVQWDVANTNSSPISCDSVNIYLSIDGGYTWPYLLAKTANTGSAVLQMPNISTRTARIKVKGAANVFFSINPGDFVIDTFSNSGNIVVFPVPVNRSAPVLNVYMYNTDKYEFAIYNAVGQLMETGTGAQQLQIKTNWPAGVYYIRLQNLQNNAKLVKPFVVQ